jgi:hypothetical protein
MATYYARKAGNINAVDVWATTPGGTASDLFPTFTSSDVLMSNSFIVTVNVSATVAEVRNDTTGGATAGGSFSLSSGSTLTASIYNSTGASCVTFSAASPASALIVSSEIKSFGTINAPAVIHSGSGTLNITSTIIVGGAASGGVTLSAGVLNSSTGTTNITCSGGVTGGSGSQGPGVGNSSTGTINITGNCLGGSNNSAQGARNVAGGTITITGAAVGSSLNTTAPGATNLSTGTINITRAKGNAYGPGNTSDLAAAVGAANLVLGVIQIEELEYGEYGMSPTSGTGIRLKKVSTNAAIFNYVDTAGAKTLVDATTGQMPAATDVRDGVSYASGALTGSCKVPAAASVAFGVPVDATTGTAALEPSDIAAAVWNRVLTGATHNIPSSAGRRLRILDDERIIADGQVVSATTNTITLQPIGSLCVGQTIVVTSDDTGEKQTRFILAFDSATNTASVDTQWCNIPQAGDEYLLTTVRDPLVTRNDHPAGTVGAEIDEMYLIHGLKDGEVLTVTPTSRTAGAIAQTIGGDGTNTTTVSRD